VHEIGIYTQLFIDETQCIALTLQLIESSMLFSFLFLWSIPRCNDHGDRSIFQLLNWASIKLLVPLTF